MDRSQIVVGLLLLAAGISLDLLIWRVRNRLSSRSTSLSQTLMTGANRLRQSFDKLFPREITPLPENSEPLDPAPSGHPVSSHGETQGVSVVTTRAEGDVVHVQISADIPPAMVVHITIETQATEAQVGTPAKLLVVQSRAGDPRPRWSSAGAQAGFSRLRGLISTTADRTRQKLAGYDLAMWLFLLGLGLYLGTRLIGLDRFPIYFFTDEAIQTQSMVDLVRNHYVGPTGVFLPTYFQNGTYFNLSASVYAQWLPYVLFGESAVITRLTSVLITLIAAFSVGIALRDIFKVKYWWTATLLLSITPAWFLHSRTAFETAEFVALYAGALLAYLFYRYKSPRYIYLTILLSGLAFYAYSAGQVVVTVTAALLVLSDWRYHWQNRRVLLLAIVVLAAVAGPYVRFRLASPDAPFNHLRDMGSYLVEPGPVSGKIVRYLSEFAYGLSPAYWYLPNDRDFTRHLMKNYGHIMIATLPFALLGLGRILRTIREFSSRVLLIGLVVAPAGAALVQIGITRVLSFVVPAAMITALGLDIFLGWLEAPRAESAGKAQSGAVVGGLTYAFGLGAFLILGGASTNRFVFLGLLAIQILGIGMVLARRFGPQRSRWGISPLILSLVAFGILAAANVGMLRDALVNGPLWYSDYGMGGMQYGGFQIFAVIKDYLAAHPGTNIIFSPTWANGTDVLERFFLGDSSPLQMGSIEGHLTKKLPLDDNTLFIMTPDEFNKTQASDKFKDIRVEQIFPYPDGTPGFYFVRLRYVDNIDEIFSAEEAARRVLRTGSVSIAGEQAQVRFSYLDSGDIPLVFDGDPYTFARTMEANPFVIELTFVTPRTIKGFSIIIGSIHARISLDLYPSAGGPATHFDFQGDGSVDKPELSFDLAAPVRAQVLHLELLDPYSPAPTHVHIWEVTLR